jgi:hypothetical protein
MHTSRSPRDVVLIMHGSSEVVRNALTVVDEILPP